VRKRVRDEIARLDTRVGLIARNRRNYRFALCFYIIASLLENRRPLQTTDVIFIESRYTLGEMTTLRVDGVSTSAMWIRAHTHTRIYTSERVMFFTLYTVTRAATEPETKRRFIIYVRGRRSEFGCVRREGR